MAIARLSLSVLMLAALVGAAATARPTSSSGAELMAVRPDGQGRSVLSPNCPGYALSEASGAVVPSASGDILGSACSNQAGTELDVSRAPFGSFRPVVVGSIAIVNVSLTRDGTKIAFNLTRAGRVELNVVNSDGSDRRVSSDVLVTPSWAPDNSRLVAQNAAGQIVVVDAGGHTRVIGAGEFPAWQPRGSWIAYTGRTGVLVLERTNGSARVVPEPRVAINQPIAWSPNGQRLAFVSGSKGRARAGLRILDLRSMRERLVKGLLAFRDPAWSPDGSKLSFFALAPTAPVGQQLYVVHADGTHLRLVGNYGPNTANVGWSRTNQLVFIGTNRSG